MLSLGCAVEGNRERAKDGSQSYSVWQSLQNVTMSPNWPLPTKSILPSLHPSFGLYGGFQSFTA